MLRSTTAVDAEFKYTFPFIGWVAATSRTQRGLSVKQAFVNVGLVVCLLSTIAAKAPTQVTASIEVVRDGEPAAVVVVARDASANIKESAKLLCDLIEQSTGAKLPIVSAPEEKKASIFVGQSPHSAAFKIDQSKVGEDDGFDISFPSNNAVVILGKSDHGTGFGVHEFLERYVGVRWLMPGPFGTDVPKHRSLAIPMEPVRQVPSFSSRQLITEYRIGTPGGWAVVWARHNRSQTRLAGQAHWLNRLFSWATDGKAHPEFFPITQSGVRFRPTGPQGWQPCLNPAITAGTAVERITNFFDKTPTAESYALSVNDNGNYCRCEHCKASLKGNNYSNAYYPWVSKVAEEVTKKHPDKLFGVLAYNNVAQVPDGPVHPSVVPFMTDDRLKWAHPKAREQGEELTRQWHEKCPTLAWYDYLYGTFYLLPRVYPHQFAETLRFGHKNGVKHYYAETAPHFGEGPKLFVALKLLWNVDADVDALLKEWCERTGGKEAAPYLMRYYAFWEEFWTKRMPGSSWFTIGGTYLPIFGEPNYLLEVTEKELAECRTQMESALAKAQTPEQKDRVRTLYEAFEFYEASAIAYQAGTPRAVANQKDALECFDRVTRANDLGNKRLHLAKVVFPKNPVLSMVGGTFIQRFTQDRGAYEHLSSALAWAGKNPDQAEPVLKRFRELEALPDSDLANLAKAVRVIANDPKRLVERVRNGSFEETEGAGPGPNRDLPKSPPSWDQWRAEYSPSVQVRWTEAKANTGKYSVKITDGHAVLLQYIRVKPGETFLASVHLNGRLELTGNAKLVIQWKDEKGKWMFNSQPSAILELQPGEATEGWVKRSSSLIRVPPGASLLVINVGFHSKDPDDYLFIDDVSVKQVIME